MASNSLSIPISRELKAALKELASQVKATQPAESLHESNRSLQAVKHHLSAYSDLVVTSIQTSGLFSLSPSLIAKLVLKVHQTILEITEDFPCKNNVLEAHGLLSILNSSLPSGSPLLHSEFVVEIVLDKEPDVTTDGLKIPLHLVNFT